MTTLQQFKKQEEERFDDKFQNLLVFDEELCEDPKPMREDFKSFLADHDQRLIDWVVERVNWMSAEIINGAGDEYIKRSYLITELKK